MARFPWSKTITTFFHALSLKVPISPHPYQPKHYQVFSSLQIWQMKIKTFYFYFFVNILENLFSWLLDTHFSFVACVFLCFLPIFLVVCFALDFGIESSHIYLDHIVNLFPDSLCFLNLSFLLVSVSLPWLLLYSSSFVLVFVTLVSSLVILLRGLF